MHTITTTVDIMPSYFTSFDNSQETLVQHSVFPPESYQTPDRVRTATSEATSPVNNALPMLFPLAVSAHLSDIPEAPLPYQSLIYDIVHTPVDTRPQLNLEELYAKGQQNGHILQPETQNHENDEDDAERDNYFTELISTTSDNPFFAQIQELIDIPKCPISLSYIRQAVTTSAGATYEKSAIDNHIRSGGTNCPATNMKILSLRYNRDIQQRINAVDKMYKDFLSRSATHESDSGIAKVKKQKTEHESFASNNQENLPPRAQSSPADVLI